MKNTIKIFVTVGARPNFIKIGPLFEEFKKYKKIKPVLVHTGQHYDYRMSQVFFRDLRIPKPDYNLGIGSGPHGWQTGKIMIAFESVCLKGKPDLIMVVGDVNSALACALVAVKLHIPVAHLEAGPRQYDKSMPEEINRILIDHVSDFLFCPTKISVQNLENEGIKRNVCNTGDIMYDAFLKNIKVARKKSQILKKLKVKPKSYFLLTLHRPSNVDNLRVLKRILESVAGQGEKIVFPVHPRAKKQIKKLGKIKNRNNFLFMEPASYLDMLALEESAKKIITDSGGVQKEAYFLRVPCITLIKGTGWPETVMAGWNILVGSNKEKIVKALKFFDPKGSNYAKYFGDGQAAKKIIEILLNRFSASHYSE